MRCGSADLYAEVLVSTDDFLIHTVSFPTIELSETWRFIDWQEFDDVGYAPRGYQPYGSSQLVCSLPHAGRDSVVRLPRRAPPAETVAAVVWPPRFLLPACTRMESETGNAASFDTYRMCRRPFHPVDSNVFACPWIPLLPPDTTFRADASPRVPAYQKANGHLLVRPYLNGQLAGWFIVDTGASGMVLEPSYALEYGCATFGEQFVTGVSGSVRSQMARGDTMGLGAMTLRRPLFMLMTVQHILGTVVGRD